MNCRALLVVAALLLLGAASGCKNSSEQATAPAADSRQVAAQPEASPAAPAAVAPVPAEPGPAGPAHVATAPQGTISGKVLETMNAAGYTYVQVETASGPVWAALPETRVDVGKEVVLAGGMEMKNFESKTLGRTFESLIFSSGLVPQGSESAAPASDTGKDSFAAAVRKEAASASAMPAPGGDSPASGGSAAAVVPFSEVKVDKAEGDNAFTIGELYAGKGDLNGRKVRVRGKVVKVSRMIMGKNWLHLQDGTGDPDSRTHDLVVTTSAEAQKDAVVVVEGTLHADRDFGAGYRYEVIVEDAEVQ